MRFLQQMVDSKVINKQTKIAFFVESNCGGIARPASIYRRWKAWMTENGLEGLGISDDATEQNRPGFWLTSQKKEEMAIQTLKALRNHKLRFHDPVIQRGKKPLSDKLIMQMENYKKHFRPVGRDGWSTDSRSAYSYSGKHGNDVDDLCVIMQECALLLPRVLSGDQRCIEVQPKVSAQKKFVLQMSDDNKLQMFEPKEVAKPTTRARSAAAAAAADDDDDDDDRKEDSGRVDFGGGVFSSTSYGF